MFRSLAFLAVLSTVAAVQAIDECNLDTIYSALFDTVGSACVAETGIDTTSPWSPSPEDITAFCGNANCRTVNQRLHDAYPNDCYISSLDTNLLLGLFGDLPCMANTGNTGTSGNTGTTGTTGNTGATGTTGATGPGVAQTGSGCPDGQYPMSVEGVGTIYCVSGLACAGTESKGVCPGPLLPDLPYGSTCGLVRTNVYGCKPFLDASQTTTSEVSTGDLINCASNPGGNKPVSVAGAGTFCGPEPVCAGANFGNCPGALSGLTAPARCDFVQPGVYGCTVLQ